MLALRASNATRVLAEDQDEYHALAIVDEVIEGIPYMTSIWEPTPKELEALINGGQVRLSIVGTAHPPVQLSVQSAPSVNATT